MPQSPGGLARFRWADAAGWIWLLAVAGFLAFFLLPRKGVDFGDEGWVLTSSWGVVHGWHWDQVIPQAPTWAVNALLMAAGVESYLALRWAFYGLISLCVGAALLGLEPHAQQSGLRAGLVTFAGLTTLTSLIAYNTTPHYLILASVGLALLTADVERPAIRAALVLLAAAAASMGGFLNFTMYPAAFASLGLAWVVSTRRGPVAATMVTAGVMSGIAVAWYLREVGLSHFLHVPGGHGIHPSRIVAGARVVLEWVAPAVLLRLALGFATRGQSLEVRQRWLHRGAAVTVLVVSVLLLSALLSGLQVCDCGGGIVRTLFAGASWIGLEGLARLHYPGMIIATWGVAVLVFAVTLCFRNTDVWRRGLALTGAIYACYVFQELFSAMDPLYLFVYYAGPCLALGFYLLWHRADAIGRLFGTAALGLTLTGAIAYSVSFTQPGVVSVWGAKADVPLPRLEGLKESPERIETLTSLVAAFEDNGCRGRTVVTFNTVPFLYYLFDTEPPRGLEYIFLPYFFDPDATLRTLESSASWCAFVSWNVLTRANAEPIRAEANGVIEYLKRRSGRVVSLSTRPTPVHQYDDFTLYVGPARSSSSF